MIHTTHRISSWLAPIRAFRLELFRSSLGVFLLRIVSLAIAFSSSIILARALQPDGYGAYSFIMSLANSLALFAFLGFPELIAREAARYELEKKWAFILGLLKQSRGWALCSSLALTFFVYLVCSKYSISTENSRFRLMILAIPIFLIAPQLNITQSALRGLRRVVWGNVASSLIQPLVAICILIALLRWGKVSPETAIIAQVSGLFFAFLIAGYIFRKLTSEKFREVTANYDSRKWLSTLPSFAGIAALSFVNIEFISIFLGLAGSNQDLAYYRAAVNLALIVALPLSIIESAVPPYITRLYFSNQLDQLERLTQVVSVVSLVLSLVPALLILFYGKELILLVYGVEYLSAHTPLVVIVIGYVGVSMVGLSMRLLVSTKFHSAAFRISAIGSLLTLVLCCIAIPYLGAVGAALALGGGKLIRAGLFVVEARRKLGIKTSLIY